MRQLNHSVIRQAIASQLLSVQVYPYGGKWVAAIGVPPDKGFSVVGATPAAALMIMASELDQYWWSDR